MADPDASEWKKEVTVEDLLEGSCHEMTGMGGLMMNGTRRLTGGRRFGLNKKQKKGTIREGGKAVPTWPVLVIRRHPQQTKQNSLPMQRV